MTSSKGRLAVLYPKISDELKPSQLYAENNLDYDQFNAIFKKSSSVPNMAANIMVLLFEESEILACLNVAGRNSAAKQYGPALDPKRIQIIRKIVQENSIQEPTIWQECVHKMNHRIADIKKRWLTESFCPSETGSQEAQYFSVAQVQKFQLFSNQYPRFLINQLGNFISAETF